MNKEPKINFVEKSTDFVGIKLNKNEIEIYIPQVFRKEENYKRDLLLFLNSISLAKTIEHENIRKGKKEEEIWPFNSYLWIINDFLESGYYHNREKTYSDSHNGKIEWKKTLNNPPIYSNGQFIYDKLITSRMSISNDIIAQIYKLCLKQSINRVGWLYNYDFYVDVRQLISTKEMIATIQKELLDTFDDIKRTRYSHMLKILKASSGNNLISNFSTYGIENYHYVFETMVDMFFDGIKDDKKKYNPNSYWKLNSQAPFKATSLRPDTILKRNEITYILDAKMYQYGATHNINDLPSTDSIQKQITYGDHAYNKLKIKKIRNAFILPYNKKNVSFINDVGILRYNDSNLVYFGQAYADWRSVVGQPKDYEKVFAYGIDFNYLLKNYKKIDTNIIDTLCSSIEEQLKIS